MEAEPAPAAGAPGAEPEGEKKDLFTMIQESVQASIDAPAAADSELIFVGAKNSGKSSEWPPAFLNCPAGASTTHMPTLSLIFVFSALSDGASLLAKG